MPDRPLDPAVAAVRLAGRGAGAAAPPGGRGGAAVSGGADSLALLAGLAWEAPRAGRRCGAAHVDHGLVPGSAEQALRVAEQAKSLDVDVVEVVTPPPVAAGRGESPEAAARRVRYAALDEVAERTGAELVLVGHTRDDQAESVLLGLVRGSGARSLAGIPPRRGRYARPLLDLPRATTEQACAALGLVPWSDPSNAEPAALRNRVRHEVLPYLEAVLGPGVGDALARTAALLRADADHLDEQADGAWTTARVAPAAVAVAPLRGLPDAVRTRVLRRLALAGGAPAGLLGAVHVRAMDDLVRDWRGQGPVALPGGLVAVRRGDRLAVEGGCG